MGGTGVLPSILVMMTVCDTSGRVNSFFTAAAEAQNEETPGTTSYGIPSASSLLICSFMAPYIDGSPVCTRTTFLPALAAGMTTSITWSRSM